VTDFAPVESAYLPSFLWKQESGNRVLSFPEVTWKGMYGSPSID